MFEGLNNLKPIKMAAIAAAKKREEEKALRDKLPGGNLMKRLANIRKKKVLSGALGPLARMSALRKEIDEKKALAQGTDQSVIEQRSALPSQTISNIDHFDD